MTEFEFYKMSGHGNDFILVDNWDGVVAPERMPELARALCRRRLSVGADGIVFIEEGPDEVDFGWRFFNADGSEAEMCGNAGRCAARFAYLTGIAPAEMSFMTLAGVIQAEVQPQTVTIQMTQPSQALLDLAMDVDGDELILSTINTGVPHAVRMVDNIEQVDVVGLGRSVREHPDFQPAGTNVNFVCPVDRSRLVIRTYERGVEDETLACGTGAVASVLIAALKDQVDSPTRVVTQSGETLVIHFERDGDGFGRVFMEGPVRVIYTATVNPEALL
jgi:diaminopimelate epimerase